MATSCRLMRIFCKEKKPNTNLVSVPIDDERCCGPFIWDALFSMAAGYPEKPDKDTQERAAMWLECLDCMFPVESYKCSYNTYKANYDLNDVASSKKKMVAYFVDLHNRVSDNLDHMSTTTSEEVMARYSKRYVEASNKVYNSCSGQA